MEGGAIEMKATKTNWKKCKLLSRGDKRAIETVVSILNDTPYVPSCEVVRHMVSLVKMLATELAKREAMRNGK